MTRVGEVRPSQVMWAYGPGSLIDLPNISVLTLGLNRWKREECTQIEEARLLSAVRQMLGAQVEALYLPPIQRDETASPFSAAGRMGMPVMPFPRWLRCIKCGRLAEYNSGQFAVKSDPFRPERTHFEHTNCPKGHRATAVPARFLLACRNGHLDDFPWHWFVHDGHSDCQGLLRFFEIEASLLPQHLFVKCDTCGKSRSLATAFGSDAYKFLPACRGHHPHINRFEGCDATPRTILLGATNGWFPVTVSVLAIPILRNALPQLIAENWSDLTDITSEAELKIVLRALNKKGLLLNIAKWNIQEVWREIEARRAGKRTADPAYNENFKVPEWEVLTAEEPPADWPHFLSRHVDVPSAYSHEIANVLLLERLREVNALVGFTRVEAPDETDDPEERPPMAPISRDHPSWVAACEVFGEGIFIQFNEKRLSEWEARQAVKDRDERLETGHRGWRNARHLNPNKGYPGVRYVLLHTLAHMLIRELSLECGYNTASLRERVYATRRAEGGEPMAGILIYTAAPDSDGTLGGLVELGAAHNLGRIIAQALARATICSSDPLCADHSPAADRSTHASACHACCFLPETSCEKGNRYLDRKLVVPVIGVASCALFDKLNTAGHAAKEDKEKTDAYVAIP